MNKREVHVLKSQSGFTLMELMIVAIIMAVVAGLAIPSYLQTVERSRSREAIEQLGTIRQAQGRYFSANSKFTTTWADLDVGDPALAPAQLGKLHFGYALTTGSATDLLVTATRNTEDASAGCSKADWTVTIDEEGTVVNGC